MSKNTKCPVSNCNGFCWKNPVHVVLFLAVLPLALKGLAVLWAAVQSGATTLTN